jgi:hypothetical protein
MGQDAAGSRERVLPAMTYNRLESLLVAETHDWLSYVPSRVGCYWEKRHGEICTVLGAPDFSGCIGIRRFELELKAPGKMPTKKQELELARWHRAGATTGWADSIQGVHQLLAPLVNQALLGPWPCQGCQWPTWMKLQPGATVKALWTCHYCGEMLTERIKRDAR